MRFLMKNSFLLLLIVSNIFILESVYAWGGYTWPYFVPREGTMCPYMEPSDSNTVDYYPESCLKWADPTTFGKFRKWKLLFGKEWWDLYIDKNALYFHPMNGEWERIELDVKAIWKTWRNYFYAGDSLYYNWLPLSNIKKVNGNMIGIGTYLDDDTLVITHSNTDTGELYYRWVFIPWIDAIKLENDTISFFETKRKTEFFDYPFFIEGAIIYIPDIFELHKIEWVDLKTFRKNGRFWYQDKNKFYRFIYGHYGFDIETIPKFDTYKNSKYNFEFTYPKNWMLKEITSLEWLGTVNKLAIS